MTYRPQPTQPTGAAVPEAVAGSADHHAPGTPSERRWLLFAARRPSRLLMTALVLGGLVLAAGMAVLQAGSPAVGAFCLLAAATPLLMAVDLAEHRLPDVITLPLAAGCLLAVGTGAVLAADGWLLARALGGGLGLTLVFALLFVLGRGSGFGFGDVKLGAAMGLCLGAVSPAAVLVGPFIGMLLAALVGAALLIGGRITRSSAIALGPYLLAGTLLVIASAG